MKARTVCPICDEVVIDTCSACISGNVLVHYHLHEGGDGTPDVMNGVKWEIMEDDNNKSI